MRLQKIRDQMKPRCWTVLKLKVSGVPLERWFLKTLITVAVNGQQPIGESAEVGKPSTNLVEIAFGHKRFQPHAGLYSVMNMGETRTSEDHVAITALSYNSNSTYIAGGRFLFRGFRFAICFNEDGLKTPLNCVTRDGQEGQYSNPMYHIKRLNFMHGKYPSVAVKFQW